MRYGFPTRVPYELMLERYEAHFASIPAVRKLPPAQFCELLAAVARLDETDYQLGKSKIFLKAGKGNALDELEDLPTEEVAGLLHAKMQDWDAHRAAMPVLGTWLLMHAHRTAYARTRWYIDAPCSGSGAPIGGICSGVLPSAPVSLSSICCHRGRRSLCRSCTRRTRHSRRVVVARAAHTEPSPLAQSRIRRTEGGRSRDFEFVSSLRSRDRVAAWTLQVML